MKQILNWIGKDKLKTFDGVIVFDECHRAKHVLLGKDGGTKTASAVIELQDALPNARIVYVVLYLFFSLSHNSCTHQYTNIIIINNKQILLRNGYLRSERLRIYGTTWTLESKW